MKRRAKDVQRIRQPPPIRLTQPQLHDFLADEWPKTDSQVAGPRLEAIATSQWRVEVGEWFAEWSGPHDDSVSDALTTYEEAQRRALTSEVDETHKIVEWARAVSVGIVPPKWSAP